MHFVLGALVLLFQAALAIHAVKTGRDRWVYLLILAPGIGGLAYFVSEILPDLRSGGLSGTLPDDIARAINPSGEIRRLRTRLDLLDSVENRQLLARECIGRRLYDEAADLFQKCLVGQYEKEPYLMSDLSRALFLAGRYPEAKSAFIGLREANPDFRSAESHLIFARTLEGLGETDAALDEYQVAAGYYPGEEAICRYGLLLKQAGRPEHASRVFEQILTRGQMRTGRNKKREKRWVDLARENLS